MKILLLEDEYTLRKSLKELLEECNYTIDDYSNGSEAFNAIYKNNFDLFLLDVNVPGMSGFDLLEQVRKNDIDTPAIFITSFTEIDNLERGFDLGCNDYIKKPFDLAELRLRVATALKQNLPKSKNNIIDLGNDYKYDTKNFILVRGDEEVLLSKTEKMIFDLFVKNMNHIVSQEMIIEYVWDSYVDPANVRVQINNMRKKLDKSLIKNIRGVGYKLEA